MADFYSMFAALSAQEAEVAVKQAEMRMKLMQLSSGVSSTTTRRGKCPGCGSHEFRKHYLRTICSYCRVEV